MVSKRERQLQMTLEKKRVEKAIAELLSKKEFVAAREEVEKYHTAIINKMVDFSASDTNRLALDIYARMAEIKLLQAILANCKRLPLTDKQSPAGDEQ